jgi:signal transduction histidine kinase
MDIEAVPVDLAPVLEQVVRLHRVLAEDKGIRLELEIAEQVPRRGSDRPVAPASGPRQSAGQRGQVHECRTGAAAGHDTRICARHRRARPGLGLSSVSSSRTREIGMSAEQIAQLFRPFTQADASTSRTYGGTGLGLAISQHLVGLMGDEIQVSSRPGEGSEFSFEIVTTVLDAAAP